MNKKPSLFNASNHLSYLMDQIDEGADLTESLIAEFNQTREEISLAIDRRKYVLAESDARIEAAKKMISDAKDFIKKIENVKHKIKSTTLKSLKLNPDCVFKDSLGRKVSIRKSPGKVSFDIKKSSTSISNVVEPDTALDPEIAPYISERTYYVIDTDRVKRDLNDGKDLSFARLDKSEYISGI